MRLTKVDIERATIPINMLWNGQLERLPIRGDIIELDDLRAGCPNNLNFKFPRSSALQYEMSDTRYRTLEQTITYAKLHVDVHHITRTAIDFSFRSYARRGRALNEVG